MKWDVEMIAGLVIVVLFIVLAFLIEHHGYSKGVAARNAYYEPILLQAAQDKAKADLKAQKADERAAQINTDLESEHAQDQQALEARAAAAESRIADLLHQRAQAAPHCDSTVPAVPPAPAARTGPAPGDERDYELAGSVSEVGKQCEHDADALAEWQQWYSRQRQSLNQLTATEETH